MRQSLQRERLTEENLNDQSTCRQGESHLGTSLSTCGSRGLRSPHPAWMDSIMEKVQPGPKPWWSVAGRRTIRQ